MMSTPDLRRHIASMAAATSPHTREVVAPTLRVLRAELARREYAAYVESDSDEPGWSARSLDPGATSAQVTA